MVTNDIEYMRRWRESHKEQDRANHARYRAKHRARIRARITKWKKDHHDHYRKIDNAGARIRYAKNPKKFRSRSAAWAKAHKEKRRAWFRMDTKRLSDSLVRKYICTELGLKASQVPMSLVNAERELVRVRRVIRDLKTKNPR